MLVLKPQQKRNSSVNQNGCKYSKSFCFLLLNEMPIKATLCPGYTINIWNIYQRYSGILFNSNRVGTYPSIFKRFFQNLNNVKC